MVAFSKAIACRFCGQIFPHAIPLLYHVYHIHCREGYTLKIQRNGPPVSMKTRFKFDSKQGHSQIPSRRNNHAIFSSKFEQIRGQVNKVMEIDPIDFTEPLIKKLDKPFTFDNVGEDEDQNLDLKLKL
ncbi:unnamed protein product [Withania somnifera]